MQAKLILIAATATIVIAAIVVSFAVIFGAGTSGNFKITGRQYFNKTSTLGYEEISASHLDGNIKFTYLRQSSNENDKFLLQVVDDMAYEYAYDGGAKYEHFGAIGQWLVEPGWVLVSCMSVKGISGLYGISKVGDVKVEKMDDNTFVVGVQNVVGNYTSEIFTLHMKEGKPSTFTRGSDIEFTVTDWAQDAGELAFPASLPWTNDKCDGKLLLTELASKNATGTYVPPIPEGVTPPSHPPTPPARRLDDEFASMGEDLHENERRLGNYDATGYAPWQDHWWTQVVGFAKYGNDIGYDGRIVNNDYMSSMGFEFKENVIRENAQGVFYTFKNGQGCGASIAGTGDGQDAIEDLMFWRRTCYGTGHENSCHAGFMQHYDKLRGRFWELYNIYNCAGKKMIFAGHSLGGATAMVMAHDYLYFRRTLQPSQAFTMTVGAPRPFVNGYIPSLGNSVRQVNEADPIPLLPPNAWWMFSFSYSHPWGQVNACSRYWEKRGQWNYYRSCYWWGCWGYWWYDTWWVEIRECHYARDDWNYSFGWGFTHLLTTYFDYHNSVQRGGQCDLSNPQPW